MFCSPWSKLSSLRCLRNDNISSTVMSARKGAGIARFPMATAEYSWHEIYKAALFETDWTKIHERIQTAESAVRERECVLSEDHGGTPEERIALAGCASGSAAFQYGLV